MYLPKNNEFICVYPRTLFTPPDLTKSIILSLLITYWKQNSCSRDYIKKTRLQHKMLLVRGHNAEDINKIFKKIVRKIATKSTHTEVRPIKDDTLKNRIFFHTQFHPCFISRQSIRSTYENICKSQDSQGQSFKHIKTANGEKLTISRLRYITHVQKIFVTY